MSLNLDFVRSQFPALADGYVYMDNAGGSQVLQAVGDRVRDHLLSTPVQLGASYEKSQLAGERVAQGQEAAAVLMGALRSDEVVLGSSATQLVSNLALAMCDQFEQGDEVIVTNVDHHANVEPWWRLEKQGVVVKTWPVNTQTWSLEWRDLEPLLTERTKLVCFGNASNVVGTIHPVKELTHRIHEHGAKVCVDGVAYSPHRMMNVAAWDVDFYVISFYKSYGPHISALYGKYEHLETLANINHHFLANAIPYKLQPGNLNFELTYGLSGILDYFAKLSGNAKIDFTNRDELNKAYDAIAIHEEQLSETLLAYLRSVPTAHVIGLDVADRTRRVPTISFVVEGHDSQDIVEQVDRHKIGIRFGDFYARQLIDSLDLLPNGVVRVSMVHYNTVEEVQRLVAVLKDLI